MRHPRRRSSGPGRKAEHRKCGTLLGPQPGLASLIDYNRIKTTLAKERLYVLRRGPEKMITLAKRGDLHRSPVALAPVCARGEAVRSGVRKWFVGERIGFANRSRGKGGYCRIVKLGP